MQNGAAVSTETYTYDDASHMNRLGTVQRSEDGKSDQFGYDYASELVSAQYGLVGGVNPNRSVNYTLDLVGNRNIVTDGGVNSNYAPNALNQYTGSVGPAAITNGNEHEIASYLGVAYQYINDGQLKQATSGANVYSIKYDALGRAVKRTLNQATTYYYYDGDEPYEEFNATGNWLATNIYGAGVDEIVMRFTPTIVYTFYQDHEGSITHVYGGLTLAETCRYDAFGQPTIKNASGQTLTVSAIGNRFMFTGREFAPVNLGFYEYRARAYHPGLGRFMSEDPKGFDAGDYNLFRYCGNDPEDRTDPMGLQTIGDAAERAAMAQRSYMQSLSAADRFHIGQLACETSLQGNAAAAMVNAYNNGSGSGAGAGDGTGVHDPVINGKHYDQSSNYKLLGQAAGDRAERRLQSDPKAGEYKSYIGQNERNPNDFIASMPVPQHAGPLENYSKIYEKRFDSKGKADPLRGTGYRTVAAVVAQLRYSRGISDHDHRAFHAAGLDGFVAVPVPPQMFPAKVRFHDEGQVYGQ